MNAQLEIVRALQFLVGAQSRTAGMVDAYRRLGELAAQLEEPPMSLQEANETVDQFLLDYDAVHYLLDLQMKVIEHRVRGKAINSDEIDTAQLLHAAKTLQRYIKMEYHK